MTLTKSLKRFLNAGQQYDRAIAAILPEIPQYVIKYSDGWVRFTFEEDGKEPIEVHKMRLFDFEEKAKHLDSCVPENLKLERIHEKLISTIGESAFDALTEGRAYVYVWRRTSPWNIWVEDNKGDTLWHSSDHERISLKHFSKLEDSQAAIAMSLSLGEIGLPEQSIYKLDPNLKSY